MATTAAASASSAAMQETKAMPSNSIVHWECVTGDVLVIVAGHIQSLPCRPTRRWPAAPPLGLLHARWEPPLAVRHAPNLQLAALASAAPRVALPQPQAWDPNLLLRRLPRRSGCRAWWVLHQDVLRVRAGFAGAAAVHVPIVGDAARLHRNHRFTAMFVFLFVGLRFTPFSANAVVLLTIGSTVLGSVLGLSFMKLAGHSSKAYWTGFCEAIAAAAHAGLVLPFVEVTKAKYDHRTSPAARVPLPSANMMQMQTVMGTTGTVVC
uniref:Uncharacterized protein n=1 Tax=Oryza brachyantha TaxID=4533 RepID=J3MBY8_ORYBR